MDPSSSSCDSGNPRNLTYDHSIYEQHGPDVPYKREMKPELRRDFPILPSSNVGLNRPISAPFRPQPGSSEIPQRMLDYPRRWSFQPMSSAPLLVPVPSASAAAEKRMWDTSEQQSLGSSPPRTAPVPGVMRRPYSGGGKGPFAAQISAVPAPATGPSTPNLTSFSPPYAPNQRMAMPRPLHTEAGRPPRPPPPALSIPVYIEMPPPPHPPPPQARSDLMNFFPLPRSPHPHLPPSQPPPTKANFHYVGIRPSTYAPQVKPPVYTGNSPPTRPQPMPAPAYMGFSPPPRRPLIRPPVYYSPPSSAPTVQYIEFSDPRLMRPLQSPQEEEPVSPGYKQLAARTGQGAYYDAPYEFLEEEEEAEAEDPAAPWEGCRALQNSARFEVPPSPYLHPLQPPYPQREVRGEEVEGEEEEGQELRERPRTRLIDPHEWSDSIENQEDFSTGCPDPHEQFSEALSTEDAALPRGD